MLEINKYHFIFLHKTFIVHIHAIFLYNYFFFSKFSPQKLSITVKFSSSRLQYTSECKKGVLLSCIRFYEFSLREGASFMSRFISVGIGPLQLSTHILLLGLHSPTQPGKGPRCCMCVLSVFLQCYFLSDCVFALSFSIFIDRLSSTSQIRSLLTLLSLFLFLTLRLRLCIIGLFGNLIIFLAKLFHITWKSNSLTLCVILLPAIIREISFSKSISKPKFSSFDKIHPRFLYRFLLGLKIFCFLYRLRCYRRHIIDASPLFMLEAI